MPWDSCFPLVYFLCGFVGVLNIYLLLQFNEVLGKGAFKTVYDSRTLSLFIV